MPEKFPVHFGKKAELSIEIAAEWFKEKQPGLEIKLLREIDVSIDYIRINPEKTQTRYRNVRIKFLKKFSFGIHYIYENYTVFIIAFFHTSQSPENWK